jgi:folate-dependent phosphoribosylglycinamide formyltransferase PurN
MNIAFFSSSDFTIPILQSIQDAESNEKSLWQVFCSQYLDLLDKAKDKTISPQWWQEKNLMEKMVGKYSSKPEFNKFKEPISLKLIVTQPDRENRGKTLQNPISKWAKENQIQLFQPEKINKQSEEFTKLCQENEIETCILASFGQILSQKVLDTPKYGFINWHPSLLPKYRGATPMQSALAAGDKITGLTWLQMTKAMDAGDIYLQIPHQINESDTIVSLSQDMGVLGANTWSLPIILKLLINE